MSNTSRNMPNIYVSESHRSFNISALKEQAMKLKRAREIREITHGVKSIANPYGIKEAFDHFPEEVANNSVRLCMDRRKE